MDFYSLLGSIELGLIYAFMAVGVYLSFRVLDFPDLTVDGSFPLGAAVSSVWLVSGYHPWICVGGAIIAGSLAGGLTGFLNINLGIFNLLASIICMTALYSINIRVMGKPNISLLGEETIISPFERLFEGILEPELVSVLLFGSLLVVFMLALSYFLSSEIGLSLRATGSNPQAARAVGISTDRMTVVGLMLSNGLVALSGALYSQAQGSADVSMGIGTIVAGLVSVIMGEALFRRSGVVVSVFRAIFGSIAYRLTIGLALSVETGEAWYSLRASDLNLITAGIVVLFLAAPRLKRIGASG